MKKMIVAIIGYGMSGKYFHIPPLYTHQNYTVKYVMTTNQSRIAELNKEFNPIQIISNYETALLDQEVDLIVIATSNDVHYSYTKLALEHFKHVVVEKPFVETYKDALELYQLASKNKRILRVFHNRRYDGDILTIKELMKTHDFGNLVMFKSRFDTYDPIVNNAWRDQNTLMAGVFYDLAPHLVHHAIELFGLPEKISCSLFLDRKDALVDDHFEMTLFYNHFSCFLGADKLSRNPGPRFELVGTKASYAKYGFDQPDCVHFKTNEHYQQSGLKSILSLTPSDHHDIPIRLGTHYEFYDKLFRDIEMEISFDEDKNYALDVIYIMEQALISNALEKTIPILKIER
ncbi:MAG: Gfo/Idh/MocA family oxidoreductase [Acholeplasmataceae bacterium]|nr:Gfo/Idh/MocA family oxidoreductase [Acholeplasmataceae bacterium]